LANGLRSPGDRSFFITLREASTKFWMCSRGGPRRG
jgi:hypothetical protein